ncbi:hypothetical protein C8J57DRAFT_1530660 [Mycena rebaudengoi]|nr:hypothetical protein C8J57DRAFT_1530660 [Mycena rebaudengoi]
MPLLNARWTTFFVASTAVLFTFVGIVGWASFQEGIKNRDRLNAFGVDVNSSDDGNLFTNWTDADLAMGIILNIDSFDPNKGGTVLGFHLEYQPLNNLTSADSDFIVPSVPVRLVLQSVTSNFPAATLMPDQSVAHIVDGDVNRYPFDSFTLDYQVYAFSSPSNISYGTPMPITIFTQGTIQGFKIDTVFTGLMDDGSGVNVNFTIRRSPITKAFSIVVILVMWCLSGAIFIAAMSVFFREKKPELPLIALSTALLFALPNVRNSQPGIPSVAGTVSDMIGFFFNVLLVAVSAFSLLARFIIMSRREKSEKHAYRLIN